MVSSSFAVPHYRPHVSELLPKLIAAQSMNTRLWLRGEMVRLVDSMIDSLFLGLLISSSAQPSHQVNLRSTMSELCQLIEGEKETTNRLVRGQMDRLVNSLFLRLTNKALVNTEVSAFAKNVLIDNVKEEYDDDDEGEYMSDCDDDCEANGICGLAGENDDTNTQIGLDQDEIENPNQQNVSLESDLMVIPDVIDNSNQSADNATDLLLINKSEPQIRSVRKSTRNATNKNLEKNKSAHPVIEHNRELTPSTSGLRSWIRKRIHTKVFGGAQFGVNVRKGAKRKISQAIKSETKNKKRKQILDYDEDIDADDSDEQEDHSTNSIGEQSIAQDPNRHLQCSHCHKSFHRKQTLHRHLRVHTGERPFHCDLCDKRFSQQSHLTQHQLIHQNIKPFRCAQCGKQFRHKNNLECHLRTHSGERPHQCRYCDKSFRELGSRKGHEQAIHLHVKPFRCKQCGHTATDRSHIIRHIRMVHFGLPQTIKEQQTLNIIDDRDPRELLENV